MANHCKATAQRIHFKNRLRERFGLSIDNDSYRRMCDTISKASPQEVVVNGHNLVCKALFREKSNNRNTLFALQFEGVAGEIPVVYDRQRKSLVTTHPNMFEKYA